MDNNNNSNSYYQPYNGQYNGQYANYQQQYGTTPSPQKTPKHKGPAAKVWGKVGVGALVGLAFGICASLACWGIFKITGFADKLGRGLAAEVQDSSDVTSAAEAATDQINELLREAQDAVDNIPKVSISTDEDGNKTRVVTYGSGDDITGMVADTMPAMVSIVGNYTEYVRYFGQTFKQSGTGSGSGIIIGKNDDELLIATNNHVVENAEDLKVVFINDKDVEGVVKGTDSDMDLAIIAVKLDDLDDETKAAITTAKLGSSDDLKLGEQVVAIGNALGFGQSVTRGIVSALDREVEQEDGTTGTFIQTDAAINQGNSGGALLNLDGEVVGINSNKIGGSLVEGMGYAIPISAAEPILDNLMTMQTRTKAADGKGGFLGVNVTDVTSDANEIYGMPVGVYIREVTKGGAAEAAGLLRGDIITKLDGVKISDKESLVDRLRYYQPGETVDIVIERPGIDGSYKEKTIAVTLGAYSDTPSTK